MKILSCSSGGRLAESICRHIGGRLAESTITHFADKEIFTEINENVRGEDVFVVQSTNCPANDNLMELLIMLDTLKRASARRVTAVIPYYGYARQDRKTGPRTPISARLVADLVVTAGAHRVLTIDLHAGQIQGFFNIPTDNLYAGPVLRQDILHNSKLSGKLQVTSPDVGGVVRARYLAKQLSCDLSIIDKRREEAGKSEVMNIIGDVKGYDCILFDDMVDSAGTVCNAAEALSGAGANKVFVYATHGVFSDPAIERISKSTIEEVVVTDTIELGDNVLSCDKIRQVSIAPLLADAISRIHTEQSVSVLFD